MHRPYRDILNLKFSCLYLFPFSHKVVPQKASGGGRRGGGGGTGRIPHLNWSIYRGGKLFFFLNPGLNWTKNRLRMVSKVRNVRLGVFSGGGCHHPNQSSDYCFLIRCFDIPPVEFCKMLCSIYHITQLHLVFVPGKCISGRVALCTRATHHRPALSTQHCVRRQYWLCSLVCSTRCWTLSGVLYT